ncbi:PAS domain S-box [Bernardetia litoralis DSM 6794]|uniref:PAS domain S-box n=1 Tax=Bernardetia litoralis (strain ATCC 23117 / DSM 6794 / NBRC 15988 / NCIMB 1366 / Fx l1 / Sio-4) TaxID=880071 RepID=I4AIW9_BERLS|nr:GAF domain-containing protein [Bernardetia litoralis]AFM03904.1 PAS domain S-box [Bernardetia litoralis DSM 6794]
MNNFRFTIWQRIFGGFSILLLLFIVGAVTLIVQLNQNVAQIDEYTEVVQPSVENLKEFRSLANSSMRLITSYVYFQSENQNDAAKNSLRKLHSKTYPAIKEKLISLSEGWQGDKETSLEILNNTFAAMDSMHKIEQRIVSSLNDKNATEKNILVQEAGFQIQMQALNGIFEQIKIDLEVLIENKKIAGQQTQDIVNSASVTLRNETIFVSIIAIILGFILAFLLAQTIISRIKIVKDNIKKLSEGILPRFEKYKDENANIQVDEIGEMEIALQTLILGLKNTSDFAKEIGQGKYQSDFTPLSERDILGNSLLKMRNNLRETEYSAKERRWKNEGTMLISDILRNSNRSFEEITDELITALVRYLEANQGGFFLKEQEGRHEQLRLMAYYAWEKKRFLNSTIQIGEGLTGQAWQEGQTMYLTDVPKEYVAITSGLGKANPRSVLIVPMLLNKEVYGMIEIASFKKIEPYQIEFLETIGETVAATLSILQSNITSNRLLEESDQMTQQLRAQEEEMRQNMEELQATQEEMSRVQKELQYRNELIQSSYYLLELDYKKNITIINDLAVDVLGYSKATLLERSAFGIFAQEGELQQGFNTMAQGTIWKAETTMLNRIGEEVWVQAIGVALFNNSGTIERYVLVLADISQLKANETKIKEQTTKMEDVRNAEKRRSEYALQAQKSMLEKLLAKHSAEKEEFQKQIKELEKKK